MGVVHGMFTAYLCSINNSDYRLVISGAAVYEEIIRHYCQCFRIFTGIVIDFCKYLNWQIFHVVGDGWLVGWEAGGNSGRHLFINQRHTAGKPFNQHRLRQLRQLRVSPALLNSCSTLVRNCIIGQKTQKCCRWRGCWERAKTSWEDG